MHTLTIILTCLTLSACAGKELVNAEIIQRRSVLDANNSKLTPEQSIQVAETKYADAIKAELDIYAPLHLSQAQESITQAQDSLLKTPKDAAGIALMASIAAQHFIDDAYKNKKSVQANLKAVLAHNAELLRLEAPIRLPTDYKTIKIQLLELVELIETGQIAEAIHGQVPLRLEMSKLELNTLINIHLSAAAALIEKADDMNAERYAPVSFNKARAVFLETTTFIGKNYRHHKEVKKRGEQALWEAQHAYYVALEAKKLMQLESNESEKYILNLLDNHNNISQVTSSIDLAPQALSSANTKLLTMVSDLKAQLKSSQQELNIALTKNTAPLSNTIISNTIIAPDDDEVLVLRTFPPVSKDVYVSPYSEEPSFQADEQGFDDIEVMTQNEEPTIESND